jgi:hypothetical protein
METTIATVPDHQPDDADFAVETDADVLLENDTETYNANIW